MNQLLKSALALSALTLAACDSDNSTSPIVEVPATPTLSVQVLHASPDAPKVNVLVNGAAVLEGVDYREGSGRLELDEGTYSVAVEGILPGGNATVIGPVDLPLAGDSIYSIVAVGDVTTIEPVIVQQPRTPVSAGSARLTVLHATAAAPAVDVYVTAPGGSLSGIAPVGSFEFKGTIGPAEVAAGDYQIRVTPAGDASTIVFDSGTVSLTDGADLFLAAVPNTVGAATLARPASPISLAVLTGTGATGIFDVGTPSWVRVFHKSPDAPAVDVIVNDNADLPLVEDLAFTQFAGFVPVAADDYNVKVTAANNIGAVVIDANLSLAVGEAYDVLAVGPLAAIEPLVLNDDPRVVNTYAKVRIVHASPTAQDVDIYVTAPGTDIGTVEPARAVIPFKANTGYLELAPGSYDVTVTPTGSKTAAIGPATLSFEAGDVLTVVARDEAGGGTPLNVVITNDALQP